MKTLWNATKTFCTWGGVSPCISIGWEQPCWKRRGVYGGHQAEHDQPVCSHCKCHKPQVWLCEEKHGKKTDRSCYPSYPDTGRATCEILRPIKEETRKGAIGGERMVRDRKQVFNLKRRLCNLKATFNCLTGNAKGNGAKVVCGGWYSTGEWH